MNLFCRICKIPCRKNHPPHPITSHRVQDRASPSLNASGLRKAGFWAISDSGPKYQTLPRSPSHRLQLSVLLGLQRVILSRLRDLLATLHFALQTLPPYRCKSGFLHSLDFGILTLIFIITIFSINSSTFYYKSGGFQKTRFLGPADTPNLYISLLPMLPPSHRDVPNGATIFSPRVAAIFPNFFSIKSCINYISCSSHPDVTASTSIDAS